MPRAHRLPSPSTPLTDHIAALATRHRNGQYPPTGQTGRTPATWAKARPVLRRRLIRELERRDLWHRPPSLLGFTGRGWWHQDGPLEELLHDCYVFVFLERLPALCAQLQRRTDLEALVQRSIRNFVHERQRAQDPVGDHVFGLLRDALRPLLEQRRLRSSRGAGRLRNSTVLDFGTVSDIRNGPAASPAHTLEPIVTPWADLVMPSLSVLRGPARGRCVEALTARIVGLQDRGIHMFALGSLVQPLAREVRRRWHAVMDRTVAHTANHAPSIDPHHPAHPQGPRHFAAMVQSGFEKLGTLGVARDIEDDLRTLWTRLADWAWNDGRGRLSKRRLAKELGFSRPRLQRLFGILQKALGDHLGTLSGVNYRGD